MYAALESGDIAMMLDGAERQARVGEIFIMIFYSDSWHSRCVGCYFYCYTTVTVYCTPQQTRAPHGSRNTTACLDRTMVHLHGMWTAHRARTARVRARSAARHIEMSMSMDVSHGLNTKQSPTPGRRQARRHTPQLQLHMHTPCTVSKTHMSNT
jgi:hypothetical protein